MTLAPLLVLLLAAAAAPAPAPPDCAPEGMLRIETANRSPGLPADSVEAQPKVLYRSGRLHLRDEQPPDPDQGRHMLVVVSAPDVWIVNRADATGRHFVDPDPTPGVHAPAFTGDLPADFPAAFEKLELGCEREFFAAMGAERVPYAAAGQEVTKHVLIEGRWRVTMVTLAGSDRPQALLLSLDDQVVFALQYLSYERSSEVDDRLFARPAGIRFSSSE